MKRIIRNIFLGGLLATAFTATAQNTMSGYFLDNYTYRYQLNPAFGGEQNFVSMPGLGNLNVGMSGNLNLKDVLYNVNGQTVLFTNPNLSAEEVLSQFGDNNRIGSDIKINVISAGFKAFGGYNTVSLNARASVNARIPKSFIELTKEGLSNRTYDIENLGARGLGYAELAFNHSRDIKQVEGLRVGMAMKFLVGIASMEASFHEAHLTLGQDAWVGQANADIYANIGGFQYEMDENDMNREYVSGANLDGDGSIGPNGFGMAFDFGATYSWRDFNFSLAILDLGWITFSDTQYATTGGLRTVNTDSYVFNVDDEAPNSFSDEWDRFKDDLGGLYQLDNKGNVGSRSVSLGATLNVGVDYALPMYRKLRFGFLSTTRINGPYSWSEARFSANVAPVKCFSADVNFAVGSFGTSFGWLLNFSHTGFNMFLGMDHTLGKLAKQGVPLSSNASVNFGINFPF